MAFSWDSFGTFVLANLLTEWFVPKVVLYKFLRICVILHRDPQHILFCHVETRFIYFPLDALVS